MRLLIAAVGKLKQGPERELFAHYLGRAEAAGRKLHLVAARRHRGGGIARPQPQQPASQAEAEALLAKMPVLTPADLPRPQGDTLSSEAFARLLAKYRDEGAAGVAFLIGGADGLAPEALVKAAKVMSLGRMTLPHGLARIVLAEQIYRAATILGGPSLSPGLKPPRLRNS